MKQPLSKFKSTAFARFVSANYVTLFVAGVVLALLIACATLYIQNAALQNTLDGATILTGPVTVQTPCDTLSVR